MRPLKWTVSHAVFVPELDDQHKEIFEAVAELQQGIANGDPLPEIIALTRRVITRAVEHFAHEERLMRAARYESLRWHKRQHDAGRRRVGQFLAKIENGDLQAARAMIEHLNSWLPDHTRLADRMMASFLRNQQRCMFKATFQVGTRPADACDWVDTAGDKFCPQPLKSNP